jgi:hypothetical protein
LERGQIADRVEAASEAVEAKVRDDFMPTGLSEESAPKGVKSENLPTPWVLIHSQPIILVSGRWSTAVARVLCVVRSEQSELGITYDVRFVLRPACGHRARARGCCSDLLEAVLRCSCKCRGRGDHKGTTYFPNRKQTHHCVDLELATRLPESNEMRETTH